MAQVRTELVMANRTDDVTTIDQMTKPILELARTSKDVEALEELAKELVISLKVCKGNWGTLAKIVEALGELRTKESAKVLKKLASKEDVEEGEEEQFTARAILAMCVAADPKNLKVLDEQMKNRSVPIAKAAYEGAKNYGGAKGKDRKELTEMLMKRIEAEYPAAGGQGGSVSEEKQKRWQEVSPAIIASLQVICGQPTINGIEDWREWWKENKKNPKIWKDKEP
jgi:hypothetical protein